MKYVWAYEVLPDDDVGYPKLYTSKKKAMACFNNDYEHARTRGVNVEVKYGATESNNIAGASWEDKTGQCYAIRVFKLPVG